MSRREAQEPGGGPVQSRLSKVDHQVRISLPFEGSWPPRKSVRSEDVVVRLIWQSSRCSHSNPFSNVVSFFGTSLFSRAVSVLRAFPRVVSFFTVHLRQLQIRPVRGGRPRRRLPNNVEATSRAEKLRRRL